MSDIEDKLMAKRETEGKRDRPKKRDRQLRDQEDRLREINDSLRKKNLCVIGGTEGTEKGQKARICI